MDKAEQEIVECYKLFELRDGTIFQLMHAVNGSRKIETGVWYKANRKRVRDGTGGREYVSGFHVLPSVDDVERGFLWRFRKQRLLAIVRCYARSIRPKPGSACLLADEILITGEVVKRCPIR